MTDQTHHYGDDCRHCRVCGNSSATNEIEGRVLVCGDCAADEELRDHARRDWR